MSRWALLLVVACGPEPRLNAPDPPPVPSEPLPLQLVESGEDLLVDEVPGERWAAQSVDWDADGFADIVEMTPWGVAWRRVLPGEIGVSTLLYEAEGLRGFAAIRARGDAGAALIVVGTGADVVLVHDGAGRATALSQRPMGGRLVQASDLHGEGGMEAVVLGEHDGEHELRHYRFEAERWRVSRLSGTGALASVSGMHGADVDGDGRGDWVLVSARSPGSVLLGDGQGGLALAPPALWPTEGLGGRLARSGDLDGDGDLDVLLAGESGVRLLRQTNGIFVSDEDLALPAISGDVVDAHIVDLDQDGHLDVVLATAGSGLAIWRNSGEGRWFDYGDTVGSRPASVGATGLVVLDVDDDGDADIYLSRSDVRRSRAWRLWTPIPMDDIDDDGVPDDVDVCAATWNPDQADRDAEPFACEGRTGCARETGCALHWVGGGAYLRCETPESWQGALEQCRAFGANLLSIGSAEEQGALGGVAGGWLDLNDLQTEGRFVSADGQTPTHAPWNEGEPNDAGDGEDCVESSATGLWNDLPCSALRPYVCEVASPYSQTDPGDLCDVCPGVLDLDQADSDGDGVGDACDPD
ncbi:MAG: FG-GAP-like repeat-containing protein [Myxococcota bacterium]